MVKITLAIPGGKDFSTRLAKEISLASNIKDKLHRDNVVTGLRKIESVLCSGKSFLWDGESLDVFDYPLDIFVYYCGKDFKLPDGFNIRDLDNKYLLVTLDANECTIGMLQGKKINVIFRDDSFVPKKHGAGGQSKVRFQRNRELALKQWFKSIGNKLKEVYYEKDF
jgi:peptide chain release factor subunit 1